MFYDEATMTRPLGVAFIAPSVTTYINLNPGELKNFGSPERSGADAVFNVTPFLSEGYRVYYVDGNYKGSSRLVLDHETYILNLTEANHSPGVQLSTPEQNPKWKLLYRATQAFGLTSLYPSDHDSLMQAFVKDDQVFQKYWYLRHKGHVSELCKDACKTTVLCLLRSGRSDEFEKCNLYSNVDRKLARAARKIFC